MTKLQWEQSFSGNSEVLDTLSITRWTVRGSWKVGQLAISKLHSEKSRTSSCERPRKRQSVDKGLDLDNFQTEYKNWLKSPKNFSVNKSCPTFSIRAEQAPEGQEGTRSLISLDFIPFTESPNSWAHVNGACAWNDWFCGDLQEMFAKDSGLLLPELSGAGAQETQNLSSLAAGWTGWRPKDKQVEGTSWLSHIHTLASRFLSIFNTLRWVQLHLRGGRCNTEAWSKLYIEAI